MLAQQASRLPPVRYLLAEGSIRFLPGRLPRTPPRLWRLVPPPKDSSAPSPTGDTVQSLQWTPETADSTEPYADTPVTSASQKLGTKRD